MTPEPRNAGHRCGIRAHGSPRAIPFVRPFRRVGELSDVERRKLDRHPCDAVKAVVDGYAKEGPGAIVAVSGEPLARVER